MLSIPEPKYRKRNRVKAPTTVPTPPTPPAAPVLVSAAYDAAGPTLTLAFDRAVDVAGFNGYAVAVDDGPANVSYDGSLGATLDGPAAVVVALMDVGPAEGAGVRLSAGGGAGIVAADGGAAWAGAGDLALPYP